MLPAALAGEAATTAGVLWRVGCGQDPLTRYHERFLERYGAHRYVPLLDVTDPAIGLGIDAAFPDLDPVDLSDRRTRVLASLIGRATGNGGVEVVLGDADIAELADSQPGLSPPRTAEICVRVIAATPEDLAAGRLRLVVCPGGAPEAGTALGRFTGLLDVTGEDGDDTGLVAEIVARPRVAEGLTLAPPTGLALRPRLGATHLLGPTPLTTSHPARSARRSPPAECRGAGEVVRGGCGGRSRPVARRSGRAVRHGARPRPSRSPR